MVLCNGRRPPAECAGLPTDAIVPFTAQSSDTLFNWKLGALYNPAENATIYPNYAVAQQPPAAPTLDLTSRKNNPNNPIFDPQKPKTPEIAPNCPLFGDGGS